MPSSSHTQSHTIHAKKKRAKKDEIKEIVFDDDARREFLTGFRKRKLQRNEDKKSKRAEREKKERLETRRQHRQLLAERAAQNAAEVEAAYGGRIDGLEDDAEDWQGISRDEKDREEEYEDEEQLATVTIVEDFDPTELIHGPPPELQPGQPLMPKSIPSGTKLKRPSSTPSTKNLSNKRTFKKIHYETKAARSAEKKKQRNRKLEKAAHARGKGNGRFKAKGMKKS